MINGVCFQGSHGAYSEEAARKLFGPTVKTLPLARFEDVFNAIRQKRIRKGILPIENALTGSIHQNFDLLVKHPVWITAEVKLRIEHHLVAPSKMKLNVIKEVHSHPQALGQCQKFIKKLGKAKPIPAFDTAGSITDIVDNNIDNAAAIASKSAADYYGMQILANKIADNEQNYTRFFVIEHQKPKRAPAQANKTSIVFALKNIPGALYKSLSVFALRDLDLLKIESRPIHGSPWQYLFYVDIRGRDSDKSVVRALEHLSEVAKYLKILGCYKGAR